VHVDDVAAGDGHVLAHAAVEEQRGQVDLLAERLAVAHADDDDAVGARAGDAAGVGEHFAQPRAGGFDREAAGTIDLAEHRDLVAAVLQQHDADLRPLDEAAVAELPRDAGFDLDQAGAADGDRADQRIGDVAAFRDPGFEREIGVLEDLDADDVTRAEPVFGGLDLGLGDRGGEDQADRDE